VILAPHVKSFSFPSKIYTLMGMAKPIIVMCSSKCDAGKFINETKSGWVVESGHNKEFTALVKELYNNRELLNEFGSNSFSVVVNFTKESVGKQYDQLVRELCS
jgi:glycosyltransferase involved in cell wall biosynthesis